MQDKEETDRRRGRGKAGYSKSLIVEELFRQSSISYNDLKDIMKRKYDMDKKNVRNLIFGVDGLASNKKGKIIRKNGEYLVLNLYNPDALLKALDLMIESHPKSREIKEVLDRSFISCFNSFLGDMGVFSPKLRVEYLTNSGIYMNEILLRLKEKKGVNEGVTDSDINQEIAWVMAEFRRGQLDTTFKLAYIFRLLEAKDLLKEDKIVNFINIIDFIAYFHPNNSIIEDFRRASPKARYVLAFQMNEMDSPIHPDESLQISDIKIPGYGSDSQKSVRVIAYKMNSSYPQLLDIIKNIVINRKELNIEDILKELNSDKCSSNSKMAINSVYSFLRKFADLQEKTILEISQELIRDKDEGTE